MSKREVDINGWLMVKDNPLTKTGIYPYMGYEIGAPEPNRIYRVYRPAEELQKPETIESFKLAPFIDDHEVLGRDATPAEKKGVHGVIGENVYFDAPYIRGNLRVHSSAMQELINSRQKIELSPGYRCKYDFAPGVFDGEAYDATQRDIRINHLALVKEGRTGADVAVQDHSIITIDTAEFITMDLQAILEAIAAMSDEDKAQLLAALQSDTTTDQEGELTEAQQAAATEAATALEDVAQAATEAAAAATEAAETGSAEAAAEAAAAAEAVAEAAEDAEADTATLDALKKELAKMKGQMAAMDTASLMRQISKRDQLASRVSEYVGTFDHTGMTADQVAAYGVKKLGITCDKGHESIALDAWMQGRKPEREQVTTAMDSRPNNSVKSKLWSA